MSKSDSTPNKETVEEELKRLRKENTKLKSQKEVNNAKISEM